MAQIHLTLITRQGCHLCEVAEDLKGQYSEEVPVLLLNGEQIAFFQIDADRVLKRLEQI
jgi:hypothetical protein